VRRLERLFGLGLFDPATPGGPAPAAVRAPATAPVDRRGVLSADHPSRE
jgi:hypothetical protein